MQSQDRAALDALLRWAGEGQRVLLATVVRTAGSAPRQLGAWLALCADGRVCGSVSGGCVEDDLLDRLRAGQLAVARPLLLTYGEDAEQAARLRLPCGGRLEVLVEPSPDIAQLADLARRCAAGERWVRVVDVTTGSATLVSASATESPSWDGQCLRTVHGPTRRLLLVGAGEISGYLAQMAPALDFAVSVCDPRAEYRAAWSAADAPLVEGMPDDAVLALRPDAGTAIVALTHDPKLDDMALLEALKSEAFYVGALGSRASNARRRQRLLEHFDLTVAQVARLRGPVGLAIGSRTPPEIAIAILAELVAATRGAG
jgi:xanthine dehydrogenase accessory factor